MNLDGCNIELRDQGDAWLAFVWIGGQYFEGYGNTAKAAVAALFAVLEDK